MKIWAVVSAKSLLLSFKVYMIFCQFNGCCIVRYAYLRLCDGNLQGSWQPRSCRYKTEPATVYRHVRFRLSKNIKLITGHYSPNKNFQELVDAYEYGTIKELFHIPLANFAILFCLREISFEENFS